MFDDRVFAERMSRYLRETPNVVSFYENHYGNIRYVNGNKSKWYIEDFVLNHIKNSIKGSYDFARNKLDESKV
jgi:hypothetical protein